MNTVTLTLEFAKSVLDSLEDFLVEMEAEHGQGRSLEELEEEGLLTWEIQEMRRVIKEAEGS